MTNDEIQMTKTEHALMCQSFCYSGFLRSSAFIIRHFQPAFIKLDQIEISPNILAPFATGLLQKVKKARLFGGSVWMP